MSSVSPVTSHMGIVAAEAVAPPVWYAWLIHHVQFWPMAGPRGLLRYTATASDSHL